MKVVFGVPFYFPESIGGTEIYLYGLSTQLTKLGVKCIIIVPSNVEKSNVSSYSGVRVIRFPSGPPKDTTRFGIISSRHSDEFDRILATEAPDIYHQHEWSSNLGLSTLQAARNLGIPTIITFHMPHVICRIKTMMYKNKTQCDGRIIETRCTKCLLVTRRVPEVIAGIVANTPSTIASGAAKSPGFGFLFAGRRSVGDIALGLQSVVATVDRVAVVSQWQKETMLSNAVPAEKVACVRAGVDPDLVTSRITSTEANLPNRRNSSALRIGFLGRADPAKGMHIIVDALLKMPKGVTFSLSALIIDEGIYSDYLTGVRKKIGNNFMSKILINQPRSAVSEFFQSIDVLAVPSQWLETGPLVVLESGAWRVPVVGSNLGGIAELVRHNVDGLLIPHADVDAWTEAFVKLAQEPNFLDDLRANIGSIRTMRDTSYDMLMIYESVLQSRILPNR